MTRQIIGLLPLFFGISTIAIANDSKYYVNGNQLFPLEETDISIKKEILTVNLLDAEYTDIDVYYEFYNPGRSKTIVMGFEAKSPEGVTWEYDINSQEDGNPFIYNFIVEFNGAELPYRTGIVHSDNLKRIENFSKLVTPHNFGDSIEVAYDALYDYNRKEVVPYSYAYFFTATFKPGVNIIRHSYRYKLSNGVGYMFHIPYLLTPAARWSNKAIDDFTLQINAVSTAKHICINDAPFAAGNFRILHGVGKIRKVERHSWQFIEICMRDAVAVWHAENFRPDSELNIYSADYLLDLYYIPFCKGKYYDRCAIDRGDRNAYSEKEKRIVRNLPYASRGYIFKTKQMADFFNGCWWYMPDVDWKPTTDGFTEGEMKLINGSSL